MAFDYKKSKKDIEEILDSKAEIEKVSKIPNNEANFTYSNGIISWVGCIFVDIVDSTSLFKNENINKNVLSRILRCFTSEIIKILSDDENLRDIGIRGDCVYAIYACPYQDDLISIFNHSVVINTYLNMLNALLNRRKFPTIKAGIGLGCGEDLIIKAGQPRVVHDYIWVGKAVVNASNLSGIANRRGVRPICMDSLFYSNIIGALKKENVNYNSWISSGYSYSYHEDFYQCDIVKTNFSQWIDNGMHDD